MVLEPAKNAIIQRTRLKKRGFGSNRLVQTGLPPRHYVERQGTESISGSIHLARKISSD